MLQRILIQVYSRLGLWFSSLKHQWLLSTVSTFLFRKPLAKTYLYFRRANIQGLDSLCEEPQTSGTNSGSIKVSFILSFKRSWRSWGFITQGHIPTRPATGRAIKTGLVAKETKNRPQFIARVQAISDVRRPSLLLTGLARIPAT